MKTWKDLSLIAVPARVKSLPVDERGYPVPHTVQWVEGKPDFRVIDPQKWAKAVQLRRCGMCGEPLGAHMAFVGGPLSMRNRMFYDLPMHRDCATYALQVCPFLAAPKFGYSSAGQGVTVHSGVLAERPPRFGLGITRSFEVMRIPRGEVVLHAGVFESVVWWQHGSEVPAHQFEESEEGNQHEQ